MRPAHELTEAEAVAELEELLDHPRDTPKARREVEDRKTALELQIMLLRGKAPAVTEPAPEPHREAEPRRSRMKFTPKQRLDALMVRMNRIMGEKGRSAARMVARDIRVLCEEQGWEVPEEAQARYRRRDRSEGPADKPEKPSRLRREAEHEPDEEAGDEEEAGEEEEASIQERIRALQSEVLSITGELLALCPQERAELVTDAANLDALAHQLAKFALTGCFEVGA